MNAALANIQGPLRLQSEASTRHNAELSEIFRRMASCYRYKGKDDRFRFIAYNGASRTLNNLKEDISVYAKDLKSLDQLSGIGESIGEKIIEYLSTGKIKTYEQLKKEVPGELLELMDINGFGPATIKTLHEELKIDNRDDLIAAIEAGKLEKLKGFGPAKIENMKRGLKLFKGSHPRMMLKDAIPIGKEILKEVLKIPGVNRAEIAGSLRRKKPTIGDIDIVATAERKNRKKIVAKFISIPQCGRVLVSGETKASILLMKNDTQVDMRLVSDDEFGAALLYFTGSKEHTVKLRIQAKEKGWKLNEYGVFNVKTGQRLAGKTEEDIYHLLGSQYIPPELREEKIEKRTTRTK